MPPKEREDDCRSLRLRRQEESFIESLPAAMGNQAHCHHRPEDHISVHGGITYSGELDPDDLPDDMKGLWFFGFDCAHAGDWIPGIARPIRARELVRDFAFVRTEINNMGQQLEAISSSTKGE